MRRSLDHLKELQEVTSHQLAKYLGLSQDSEVTKNIFARLKDEGFLTNHLGSQDLW